MSFTGDVRELLEASEKPLTCRDLYERMDTAENTTQVSLALHELRKQGVVGRIDGEKPAPHFVLGSKADPHAGERSEPDPDSKSGGKAAAKAQESSKESSETREQGGATNPTPGGTHWLLVEICRALGLEACCSTDVDAADAVHNLISRDRSLVDRVTELKDEVEKLQGSDARWRNAREALEEKDERIKQLEQALAKAMREAWETGIYPRSQPRATVLECLDGMEAELTRCDWDKAADHYAIQDDGSLVLFLWGTTQMVRVHPTDTERLRRLLNGWSELVESARNTVAEAAEEDSYAQAHQ
ncbi:MAG TPA: hypothetical protein VFA86_06525 [Gammaproteobacteria bacterium]|nr:hypothetical protein [Gammaproteobacteria bacterium]